MEELLNHGADVNRVTMPFRPTPLLIALECNQEAAALLLLQRGANVNVCDYSGATPLTLAVEHGEIETAKALLQRGADVRATDGRGSSVLTLAKGNEAMRRLLQHAGSHISAKGYGVRREEGGE